MTTIEVTTVTDGKKATTSIQRETEVEAALATIVAILNQYRSVIQTFLDSASEAVRSTQ